jgi:hypothetical protein
VHAAHRALKALGFSWAFAHDTQERIDARVERRELSMLRGSQITVTNAHRRHGSSISFGVARERPKNVVR